MFTSYIQHDASDCGSTCLRIITKYYNKEISAQLIRDLCNTDREGSSIASMVNAGNKIGLNTIGIKCTIERTDKVLPSIKELNLPIICHWNNNHFVVVYKLSKNKVYIADPAIGKYSLKYNDFEKRFYSGNSYGKVLMLEPTVFFYSKENQYLKSQILSNKLFFVYKYLSKFKKKIIILFSLVFIQLLFQLGLPYLTQITFDFGILKKDTNILLTIFLIQIIIYLFTSSFEYFNSIISNKISKYINIDLSIDFVIKIFAIPLSYFQYKKSSDFINRIYDLARIESFLTYEFTAFIVAIISFFFLSSMAVYYNFTVYLIFLSYSIFSILWSFFSLKKKKELDNEQFDIKIDSHRLLTEMIEGINEIKLSSDNQIRISNLVKVQANYFNNNLKSVKLTQLLSIGSGVISNIGNGFIIFYTAYLTIDSTISIGSMAAIQLIVSQLSGVISTITNSISSIQQTFFSTERILETQSIEDEYEDGSVIHETSSITFKNVFFSYSEISDLILNDVNFVFESKKTTAIVGLSGSGKTTLLKLALGLLNPSNGEILIGNTSLSNINLRSYRNNCGVVMQDGYIFTDTIINNVTMSNETNIDFNRYIDALKLSGLYEFILTLPRLHDTKIGKEGLSLSSGQLQRILIARLFYKNPEFIFMDEATNSLDGETEDFVISNLKAFFKDKTTIIIAHRLNTVINADNIIVLSKGQIVEFGNHRTLTNLKGVYYNLVKSQLLE